MSQKKYNFETIEEITTTLVKQLINLQKNFEDNSLETDLVICCNFFGYTFINSLLRLFEQTEFQKDYTKEGAQHYLENRINKINGNLEKVLKKHLNKTLDKFYSE